MGFYGNITNTSQTQFSFDRVYTSRAEMEGSANNDGVFIGRYVLIEYDTDYSYKDFKQAYRRSNATEGVTLYSDTTLANVIKYTEDALLDGDLINGVTTGTMVYVQNNDYYDYYMCSGKSSSGNALFTKITQVSGTTPGSISNYVYNYNRDIAYAKIWGYEVGRGWDSTVWQKVYTNNIGKYVMIAELNSVVPTFDISTDAPSDIPMAPHFDELSTDVYYKLHAQPSWGFRLAATTPIKGPIINQYGQFDNSVTTQYSGYEYNGKSDISVPMTYTLYDTLGDKTTTFYYDDELQDWDESPYKMVDVTSKLRSNPQLYSANQFYYRNDSGAYIKDTNSYLTFDRTYYQEQERLVKAAIYFNKEGFTPEKIATDTTTQDNVAFLNGMSGMLYNSHDGTSSQTPNYDFKELAMILPSIGNAISSVWDIIYGGVDTAENGYRHLELEWEDASKAQKRAGLRLVNKITGGHGYSYDDNRVNTVAGCINSVHDLMGMIIVDKDTEDAYTLDADGLDGEKIYFFDKNNGYFYKKKYYDYYRIAYMYKEIALTAETYIPNMYYVATVANPNSYSSGDFTADTETAFDPSKTYYAKYSSDRNEEYTVVNVQEYTPGAYYKTDGGDYIYDEKESAQENIEYYNGDESQISEIKITNNYEPSYYYYWNDSTKTYVLDTSLSVTSGRNYYVINEGENQLQTCYLRDSQNYDETSGLYYCGQDENDQDINKPLTYMYAPGILTSTNSFFYSIEKDSEGNIIKYTPLKDEIVSGTQYYLVDLVQALDGNSSNWQIDENGNIVLVGSTGDYWTIDNIKPVSLINWEANKYYYTTSQGYKLLTKEILAEQLPLMVKRTTKITQNGETTSIIREAEFVDYYTINPQLEGNFYIPYKYYYKNNKDWILAREDNMDEDTTYYTFDASQVFTPLNATYYIANKYYFDNIINGETIKSLDKNASMTAGRTYYKKNDFFVEEDKFNLFARGSVWNKGVDVIPASVNLATRRERYGMEELTGFARTLNTIHGLILKVNQLLELEDTETRDRTTFAGTINSLNDILNKFDILEANKFTVVDSYGRIRTGDTVTDSYLSVDISGNVADTKISFAHNLSGVTGSKTITNDSTTIAYGGTFKIPVLSYNEAGHITSVTNESLTLPKNSLVSTGNGNLISDLTFNETTGAFTKTKEYIGELKLTNYSIGTAVSALAASDTLNAALGKLEYKLDKEITDRKALDYTDTEDTTQFVSSVSQEDGQISLKRASADTLLVDGVALSTVKKYVDDLRTSVGGSSIGLIYEVSQLKDTVGDSSSGLVYKVNQLEDTVGDSDSGLVLDINDLKTTLGDSSSGLVSKVNSLSSTIEDADSGLIKKVNSLETVVGTDSSGLVSDVNDLINTVGDESSGLVSDVNSLKDTLGNESSGLIESVNSLKDSVGDESSGLIESVNSLKDTLDNESDGLIAKVNALSDTLRDESTRLVQKVDNIETDVEDLKDIVSADGTGLNDRVSNIENSITADSLQADWNEEDIESIAYIKNKPDNLITTETIVSGDSTLSEILTDILQRLQDLEEK